MSTEDGTDTTAATSFESGDAATLTGGNDGGGAEPKADFPQLDHGFDKDPEIGEWVTKRGFKTVADLARNARSQQSAYNKLQGLPEGIPGDDATPEQMEAFYNTVGRPETAEAYEFQVPEGVPDDFPYDADAAGEFKTAAYEAGLRPEQARKLHDWFVKTQAKQFGDMSAQQQADTEASTEQQHQRLRDATKALEKTFDAPSGSPTFNANMEYAQRFAREHDLTGEMVSIGALVEQPDGSTQIVAPKLVAAMAQAGRTLYSEGGRHDGDSHLTTDNPWKGDRKDPKSGWNRTRQAQIEAHDPARAARLKAAAGLQPIRGS